MFNFTTTSDIYLLISITLCIICILPMMWLPVYKAEPDDAAAAEVLHYQRITAERTIQAKYEYAAWRMRPACKSILLPAAPARGRPRNGTEIKREYEGKVTMIHEFCVRDNMLDSTIERLNTQRRLFLESFK